MRALLTLAIVLGAQVAHAEIFEPGPEATGAVAAGASAVADAVKLGKQPDAKWKALFAFQDIAAKWPAALHDCYLALAHLRTNEPVFARLVLDRAATRGGDRPKWCTGDLEHQLAKALAGYVQVVLDVQPRDALLQIDGSLQLRGMTSVWVLTTRGSTQVIAEAPGFERAQVTPALVAPVTHVEIRLVAVHVEPAHVEPAHVEPAHVEPTHVEPTHVEPPGDAGVVAPPLAQPDAAVEPPPPFADEPHVHKITGKQVALGLGIAGLIGTAVGGYLAHYFHDQANALYKTDPDFAAEKTNYETAGIVAIASAGLAVVSWGVWIAFVATGDDKTLTPTNTGVMFNYGGAW